ncbi:splicing factor 3B subunit 3 isoform X2 [Pelobates cultripes]|uniref:Splicing factor 3B subunit 3 isoform X2 n=1 Tax=Pelobates cultripes TaxID=61616 RepID=A0AAD1W0X9_PELCU|nr:splicing factor 3B subunit 3 isoform X2 [Pelobates cultripes]
MISAIQKQKLVHIVNRDAVAWLTISSPLEAHKDNTLVYHMVGVDVSFENPMFACLEMDYENADNDPTGEAAANMQQTLTFYELDLGLKQVVRKYSEPLEEHGNFLITVPGGSVSPESNNLIIIETYHNVYTEATKAQRKHQMAEEMVEAAGEYERELAAEMAAAFLNENLPESSFGAPKAGNGQWASIICVMNPIQGNILDLVQLEQNGAAFSVAVCRFSNTGDDWYVLVGVAKDLILNPCSVTRGLVYTYKLINNGEKLESVHKISVEEVPAAIAPFQG